MAARIAAAATAVIMLGLAGCSSRAVRPDPTPLESPAPSLVRGQLLWSQRLGAVQLPLQIAAASGEVTLASSEGQILALDVETGRPAWRAEIGAPLSAAVGTDGRFTAAVTRANELVVLEQGRTLWRQRLASSVLTPPLVAGERVFVHAVDRSVHAFDAAVGGKLWTYQRPGDPLTLSVPGVLLPVRDTLVVGQGPRLSGLEPTLGSLRWEVPVASPRGTNEVERLADLVGPAGRIGDTVCVRAYQVAVGCVNAVRGSLAWSRNSNGSTGMAADAAHAYGVDTSSRITAHDLASGEVRWTSDRFRFRTLTAGSVVGGSVAFGDAQGYIHLLATETGATQGRLQVDGAVVALTALPGNVLVAVTRSGNVQAFRVQ